MRKNDVLSAAGKKTGGGERQTLAKNRVFRDTGM